MSQITKSVQVPVFAPRWASTRTLTFVAIAIAGLIIASAMAALMLRAAPSAITEGVVAPVAQSVSRLDDYGLRHPAAVGATTADSRLDDYGLRHRAPFGGTTTTDRPDDYGLRHPTR